MNGLRLARHTDASTKVVELFAFLHDACRHDDGADPEHGPRAAEWVPTLKGSWFDLDREGLRQLEVACRDHTRGTRSDDPTVLTCLDADRLDLGRLGITPDPRLLHTEGARDPQMIEWATGRSQSAT